MTQDPGTPLIVTTHQAEDGLVVSVIGDLDVETAETLISTCQKKRSSWGETVTFDCAEMTFLDSVGIRALIELHNEAAASGIGFRMLHVPPAQLRVLEITQLIDVLAVRGDTPVDTPEG